MFFLFSIGLITRRRLCASSIELISDLHLISSIAQLADVGAMMRRDGRKRRGGGCGVGGACARRPKRCNVVEIIVELGRERGVGAAVDGHRDRR